jgi:predicted Zn-dependent protease
MSKGRILLILAALVCLSACSGSAYKLPVVTPEESAAIESQVQSDEAKLKIYNRSDSNYKSRLAKISKRLKKSAKPLCELADYSGCYFEVSYDAKDIVNAYAHENYKITVYKGMLKYLRNDDEIAALVGHEMGHHLAKHNEETMRNAQTGAAVSGILTAVLLAASSANNPYYTSYQQQQDQQTLENMMAAGAEIGAMSYSKEQEREADLLSAYLLEHAGYNLDRANNLMYTMAKISGDDVPGKAALMDTHPPTPERVVAWQKVIEEIKNNETKLPYPKESHQ